MLTSILIGLGAGAFVYHKLRYEPNTQLRYYLQNEYPIRLTKTLTISPKDLKSEPDLSKTALKKALTGDAKYAGVNLRRWGITPLQYEDSYQLGRAIKEAYTQAKHNRMCTIELGDGSWDLTIQKVLS